jgi:hypothetical protein
MAQRVDADETKPRGTLTQADAAEKKKKNRHHPDTLAHQRFILTLTLRY